MTFNWVNVRNTAGYVSDAGGDTYCLGELMSTNVTNGRKLAGVYDFGFNLDLTASTENRISSQNPHWAGCMSITTSLREFLIGNLTPNKAYNFKACFGRYNAGIGVNQGLKVYQADDSATAYAGWTAAATADGGCVGMDGTPYATFAAWLAADCGNAVSITPNGANLRFTKNSGNLYLSAIGIEDPAATGSPKKRKSRLILTGVGRHK